MSSQKITFPNQDKPEFINELRATVQDYFKKNNISRFGNGPIIFKTVVMLIIYLLPLALIVSGITNSVLIILGCWVIMGFGMAGVGMAFMHDANHKSFSKSLKVNNWLGRSLYLLGGFPANWKQQHNIMHHSFTNIDGMDEDIAPVGILRFSPHKPLKKVHRFQHIYAWFLYGLMTIFWITSKDFKQLYGYKKEGIVIAKGKSYKRLFFDLVLAKIFYYGLFLALPLIFSPISWYWTVLFFLLMHYIGGVLLTTVFQTAHVVPNSQFPVPDTKGNIENNWAIHQLLNTTDFSPKSKLFSWFIGGLNYQVEHHLFPTISHVHYPKISKFVKELTAKYQLPYYVEGNFFVAVRSHYRMLKMLGRSVG